MGDLSTAVRDLVRAATAETQARKLRGAVEKVLDAFPDATPPARDTAVTAIGQALERAKGAGGQVLSLALGALVEAGASPDLAWPAIARELQGSLLEANVSALPSRCLAAVACLTRSKDLRRGVRSTALVAIASALGDAIPEAAYLAQAMRIVDDESWLVIAPASGRGWRIAVDRLPSNLELYVLLADVLARDGKAGSLVGKGPDTKAVSALREGTTPKKGATWRAPFELLAWTALDAAGALPSGEEPSEHAIAPDDLPADLPALDGERILFVQESAPHTIAIAPTFEMLRPSVAIAAELSSAEVVRTMVRIATSHAALAKKVKARPSKAKTKAKTKTKTTATKKKR